MEWHVMDIICIRKCMALVQRATHNVHIVHLGSAITMYAD